MPLWAPFGLLFGVIFWTFLGSGVKVKIHCFLDGRDTPPKSGIEYFSRLQNNLSPGIEIVSLVGRYFAMDRDLRWERTAKAYRVIIEGKGKKKLDLFKAIAEQYKEGITDEFLEPIVLNSYKGVASSGGGFFFLNSGGREKERVSE